VITGHSLDFEAGTITPTIWTSGSGLMDFNQFLSAQGVVTTGLGMHLGMAMSADGRTITGYAESLIGYVGWVLKTPTSVVCHASQQNPPAVDTLVVAFPPGAERAPGPRRPRSVRVPASMPTGTATRPAAGTATTRTSPFTRGQPTRAATASTMTADGTVDVAAPSAHPALTITQAVGGTQMSWTAVSAATGYDVFSGDLSELQAHAGDYASLSLAACLSNDLAATSLSAGSGIPAPGGGRWFIVRAINCGGAGTYDEGGAGQSGSRDSEIQASPVPCP
jgi:hypothetical protein